MEKQYNQINLPLHKVKLMIWFIFDIGIYVFQSLIFNEIFRKLRPLWSDPYAKSSSLILNNRQLKIGRRIQIG